MGFGGSATAMNKSIKNNRALRSRRSFKGGFFYFERKTYSHLDKKWNKEKFRPKSAHDISIIRQSIRATRFHENKTEWIKTIVVFMFLIVMSIFLSNWLF